MTRKTKIIGAMGGTFDHFHKGHEHFLQFAFSQADHVIIGITAQSLTTEKEYPDLIQQFDVRKQAVQRFLEEQNTSTTWELVELKDQFGPTLGQQHVDVLIVTELTKQGGDILNSKRKSKDLPTLPLKVCDMVRDSSDQILNSTRIRAGVVNRSGEVYEKVLAKDYKFDEAQKEQLRTQWGEIITQPSRSKGLVAVVGDRSLNYFLQNNWTVDIGVYDLVEQRENIQLIQLKNVQPEERLKNPSGVLKANVVDFLNQRIHKYQQRPCFLQIDGEEDLISVALILLLPLESKLYYGQPNVGMVEVIITEGIKEKMWDLLRA